MDFTKHNSIIDSLLPKIQSYQYNFIKGSEVYFQGLPTSSSIPTTDTSPDKLTEKPYSKSVSWSDTGLITQDLPFTVRVDEYVGPQGKGYQVFFTTSDGKDTYVRSDGFGVEAKSRSYDWTKQTEPQR